MPRATKVYLFKLPKINERTGLPTRGVKLREVKGKRAKELVERFGHCAKKVLKVI